MEFATPYYSPMSGYVGLGSRDIINQMPDDIPGIPQNLSYNNEIIPGTGVGDIGMSVPMGIAAGNVRGVAAKMRSGIANLEIQFPGAGRANRQSQTPELFGKLDRQALWELGKVNEVKFTTHASFGISGLSGQDPNSGNFSQEYRKMAIDEVKRAIEFAADVAQGGSVVVHTGEFQRPISEQDWAEGGKMFQAYNGPEGATEAERAVLRVVDSRTGQVLQQVRKNQVVFRPKWLRAEKDYADHNGRLVRKDDFIDYEGNWVDPNEENMYQRVPIFNKDTGRFDVTQWTFEDFRKEAERINKSLPSDKKITPEEAFIRATLESQYGQAKGWALYHSHQLPELLGAIERARGERENFEKMKATMSPEKWEEFRKRWVRSQREQQQPVKEDSDPVSYYDHAIMDYRNRVEHTRQGSVGYEQQAEEVLLLKKYAMPIEKFALERSLSGYAEAAMHAYNLTKQKHLKKPLFIAMENIFPESYGSHPEELRNLVIKSREKMAEELVKQKKVGTKEEAMKIAENHVKATFDTGHVNTWRKYFQAKPGESIEKTDDRFKKWLLKETEELAKSKVIGNVHLADNMGYQDDHLAPGQGTTPVKEMIAILKKHGYAGALTVEPGADATTDLSDFHGVMKTWRYFGSPVYGMTIGSSTGGDRFWRNVQNSYFKGMERPYFVFGSYAPSNDWTLWSGVPLE